MDFHTIVKNKEYRERVIKYFRLPIRLTVSEEKFLSDLDFLKQVDVDKYNKIIQLTEHDFNKEAKEQKTSEPDFTMEHILEKVIKDVESNANWKSFLKEDYSDYLGNFNGITNTHDFYKKENDGKYFLSIDLESANWQTIQKITGMKESYEDFIVKYTDNLIPPASKTVRTKIAGLLGAKKIMNYNIKLLKDNQEGVLEAVYSGTGVDLRNKKPFAFYADEFIIEIDKETKEKFDKLNLSDIENRVHKDVGIKIHFRPFLLKWLDLEKSCVKIFNNKKYEILNISKDLLLILNKVKEKEEIKDIDLEKFNLKKTSKEELTEKANKAINTIDYYSK